MKLKGIELKGTYKIIFSNTYFDIYDDKNNVIYFEDSNGYWFKNEYDEDGNVIYYENSEGCIVDKRVKELTVEEIEKKESIYKEIENDIK
jgi:hypothetical protein